MVHAAVMLWVALINKNGQGEGRVENPIERKKVNFSVQYFN